MTVQFVSNGFHFTHTSSFSLLFLKFILAHFNYYTEVSSYYFLF